jgi:hypothetical protein
MAPKFPVYLRVRLPPELSKALARAAEGERRGTSDLVRLVLTDWLSDRGYLKGEKRKPKT